ncbi:MAG TPA: accessory gene regulator AgrB [Bacillota bacterium]|nr:accessory gene regulator AgrB [Clostridiaceae bacterium]HNR04807.1 accessory gene regulator AgrB [Bacillota bacterium]HNT02179.1 accessory gene regulator AgrB [Bacillota bacterium]HOH89850.1 accessory gene regulator AgrB [Bacillota bacterium]HPA54050.1 accessory gene regulator AgrB [Bacillota bacterium]
MEFPERISGKITKAIAAELKDLSEEKLAEIDYGIAAFIANSYKMVFIFILAMLLNIFQYFLIAFVSFGALRTFASGVHAKREWTCLPTSALVFFGITYLGMISKLNIYIITFIFILCFGAMLRYAPADTEERPIVSRKLRKKLKILSVITILVLYAIAMYSLGTKASSIITFAVLFESVLILPVTYRLAGSMYGAGMKISNNGEV